MDITMLFKACVKAVKMTNKNMGSKEVQTNILKNTRDTNLIKARGIVKQVVKLQNILLENRNAYLNVVNYLSTDKTMTETSRQEIDSMAQEIINSCTSQLNVYKQEISKQSIPKQKVEHYSNIIDSIEKYLKSVSKLYAETKAIRVKRVIETHKLSKLESKSSSEINLSHSNKPSEQQTNVEKPDGIVKKNIISLPAPVMEDIETQLSAEEMQMFESENAHLFNELNSLSDEVKQIESKVVHITELQELFSEKVLQQEGDIERIATTVASSTDNVKDANEQIRQAIQRNAGLRVWVLFFLLVMSFSLLFLDWYND
ncbi:hypothetical protein ILUMI_04744 [Ignelater luminosus]|uniref:Syntaxin-18 n=1 Tax=Ignelater luminosus TaxID=2038154 RepID=A0A8K0GIR5_IGNLU|nr:hypothetical protein ILUMI_04744 [Ignelater luminosus]